MSGSRSYNDRGRVRGEEKWRSSPQLARSGSPATRGSSATAVEMVSPLSPVVFGSGESLERGGMGPLHRLSGGGADRKHFPARSRVGRFDDGSFDRGFVDRFVAGPPNPIDQVALVLPPDTVPARTTSTTYALPDKAQLGAARSCAAPGWSGDTRGNIVVGWWVVSVSKTFALAACPG